MHTYVETTRTLQTSVIAPRHCFGGINILLIFTAPEVLTGTPVGVEPLWHAPRKTLKDIKLSLTATLEKVQACVALTEVNCTNKLQRSEWSQFSWLLWQAGWLLFSLHLACCQMVGLCVSVPCWALRWRQGVTINCQKFLQANEDVGLDAGSKNSLVEWNYTTGPAGTNRLHLWPYCQRMRQSVCRLCAVWFKKWR